MPINLNFELILNTAIATFLGTIAVLLVAWIVGVIPFSKIRHTHKHIWVWVLNYAIVIVVILSICTLFYFYLTTPASGVRPVCSEGCDDVDWKKIEFCQHQAIDSSRQGRKILENRALKYFSLCVEEKGYVIEKCTTEEENCFSFKFIHYY